MQPQHELTAPSEWVCRFVNLIPAGGTVLALACGSGRHARLLAGLGYRVEAEDRDESHLLGLRGIAGVSVRLADLKAGRGPTPAGNLPELSYVIIFTVRFSPVCWKPWGKKGF